MTAVSVATDAVATTPPHAPRRQPMRAGTPAVYFVALVVIALMLGPVIYIILGGFRSNSQITTNPAGLPDPWVFTNYFDVLTEGTFWTLVLNSTVVAVVTTGGVIVLGLMASYVLARYHFRGRGALYALFAAGLMFPITVAPTVRGMATETMATYMVQQGQFAGQPGYGSAIAVILFFISLIVALVYQRFALRRDLAGAVTTGVR